MHHSKHTQPVYWLIAALLSLAIPQSLYADPSSTQSNSSATATLSPALATTVPAALQGLKNKSIYLIDVRPARHFEQYRIPGAINIPLHAIKTKAFLKTKPIVLVNEGFCLRQPAQTCQTLNQNGYRATILAGGLPAWQEKGGRLVGDPFAMQRMHQVTPQQFIQEAGHGHHLIVDASARSQSQTAAFKTAVELDLGSSTAAVKQLKQLLQNKRNDPFATVLITAADGRASDRIQRILNQAGIHTAYFLTGGQQAYRRQIEYLEMAAKPKQERTISTHGCPTCAR